MAKFSEVFSTTFKVWASLLLISLAVGVIYLAVSNVGKMTDSTKEESSSKKPIEDLLKTADDGIDKTLLDDSMSGDNVHTTMPKSKWDKLIAEGIKKHCAFIGMTKEEVEKVLGKPTEVISKGDLGENWSYTIIDKSKCIKYDGDNCSEFAQHDWTVGFSKNGYMNSNRVGANCNAELDAAGIDR